ncbi:MAG: hemerythrin domain-containing protein [Candidatus Lokiarchaeota archaeon]|nr:hemerythrin domain-containing protein [Candidatus Lokiarchaeota archaeon]
MLPIGPLMIEHRLIERMIAVLKVELEEITKTSIVNTVFIDNVVDFIRIYADQTHHGKEEHILFRELANKNLTTEHDKILKELIDEHIYARKITGDLVEANKLYLDGKENAVLTIIDKIKTLVEFYPKHIEKEDNHFFLPIMEYFSKEEKDALLDEGRIFDRKMIHRKYNQLVVKFENKRGMLLKKSKSDWIDLM